MPSPTDALGWAALLGSALEPPSAATELWSLPRDEVERLAAGLPHIAGVRFTKFMQRRWLQEIQAAPGGPDALEQAGVEEADELWMLGDEGGNGKGCGVHSR